ncbi:MAG: elongation factor Ts [Gammaproteobacteria bacterium]|nr:elongation factor Ts [Gammaproteobacteria bacterium]NIN62658.1 elongation factor Ts [Gammaproteobacteria bacterium]NIO63196.1 elongation factor Ts [Gammaproteobacteria bacterium]NIQ11308.1 elongation factor Ts [Gammaproteobacteria bacterium]NIQ20296.1 elongation factor Ts [Gammaproteobacteria bacterium]
MQITAGMVKELRELTGAGMMDCKQALKDSNGDIDAAIEAMRKSGIAKAAKKSGRIAAEGNIVIKQDADGNTVILEVNSETDFVAKDENFVSFCDSVAEIILAEKPEDIEALNNIKLSSGISVEETRQHLVAKIGENINVRRFVMYKAEGDSLGIYLHGTRIGVVVDMTGGSEDLARDIAMHVAGHQPPPVCVSDDQIPAETLDKEKEIFVAQARESGKPDDIIEKMVSGRVAKFKKEITLLGQPFVKDPDITVEKLLTSAGASVNWFIRYEVGEGLEKRSDNFAEEVMAQAKGE